MRSPSQLLLAAAICLLLSNCAPYLHQPLNHKPVRLGPETATTHAFGELPVPQEKIVAAVYKFRDQTGQYKPSPNGTSWSTAVTQGATSILLRALEESEWFIPIERENLANLLNERKIIRSSRAEFGDNSQQMLPPLLFAGVILEGGIISYDANVITGGAGLRYFGTGASGQYREDRVTVYLRAISTSNGRILKTVYTTRTILSQMIDVGVFRFVKFKRLLEVETGFTYNEPTEIAVKDAIEKAVYSLVMEGMIDGLWNAQATGDSRQADALKAYVEEKELNEITDHLGRELKERRDRISVSPMIGSIIYAGDYSSALARPMLGLQVMWNSRNHLGYGFRAVAGELGSRNFFKSTVGLAEASLIYRVFPKDTYTPYLQFGSGLMGVSAEGDFGDVRNRLYGQASAGLGFEYMLRDKLGLSLGGQYHYIFSDRLDEMVQGKLNDAFWNIQLGLGFYF